MPKKFDIEEELKRSDFRVAVFGSARIKSKDPIFKDIVNLGKEIGKMGIDIVTGGGPGLMEATAMGHKEGTKYLKNKRHVSNIGLNIALPMEQKPNTGIDEVLSHERFSSRLDNFMLLSNVVVVAPGGIGTLLELAYTWQLAQVHHICHIPIVLIGEEWASLIEWVKDWPLKHDYMSEEDLQYIITVPDSNEALEIIKRAKLAFDDAGPEACMNWHLYGEKRLADK
ncbi:LOG family protein [Patescibacteria group bacterium]|nr:LOG family protein [Patescibacteria group bacterium]